MNCLDFRRLIGADPAHADPAAQEHAANCAACADFAQRMRELDRQVLRALQVPLPTAFEQTQPFDTDAIVGQGEGLFALKKRIGRQRWAALAASVLVGAGIAATMWFLFPRGALASDLVEHMAHESQAWTAAQTVSPEAVEAVLKRVPSGGNLKQLRVSYAQTCWFRGHFVPHLIVQEGPRKMALMLLAHEDVKQEQRFAESGYSGVIIPARRGSVAVLTQDPAQIEAAAETIRSLNLLGN